MANTENTRSPAGDRGSAPMDHERARATRAPAGGSEPVSTIIKALAAIVNMGSREFRQDPGHEYIDREQVMQLILPIRDAAYALSRALASAPASAPLPLTDERIDVIALRCARKYRKICSSVPFGDELVPFVRDVLAAALSGGSPEPVSGSEGEEEGGKR